MSSGLCDCFLLRRHGATRAGGAPGGQESRVLSQETLMSQDLVYQEISVSSLPETQNQAPPKQDPAFNTFQTSTLLIDSTNSSKSTVKSNEKKRNSTITKEVKNRLSFLLQKPDQSCSDQNTSSEGSSEKPDKDDKPTSQEALEWSRSLEVLLSHHYGVVAFRSFLRSEFSEENIEFWLACQDYRGTKPTTNIIPKARKIFSDYIGIQAPKEINLDSETREAIMHSLAQPTRSCFDVAQTRVYSLMEKDSYPRFLKSKIYLDLVKQGAR
ncbi:regulator of G-protein signaling 8-like [Acipenser oxyrinchus oxyrinchus]|uniref:Regulator of G-protein signaling 8-like n=1 Tax=Acipenser oxyrinchus oxyrinchus TaxID=40147 RepID=A0AAD8CLD9_ACIOX|nr:regulator of G-protein signaling 8-like [Acipenser oxyrinchus oxyrinchus]